VKRPSRLRVLGATLLVLGLTLLPAAGAMFQLGVQLSMIAALHRAAEGTGQMEPVATYEVDEATGEASMRLHSVLVRR
jgi:hypothetical protein